MARFYNKDGTEVAGLREARKLNAFPSVTTIINGCTPHEYKFLDDKRLRDVLASDDPIEDKLDELGNKPVFEQGNVVHEATELYIESGIKSDPLNCALSTKELYAYIDLLDVHKTEEFYYSDGMKTGGRIDLLASIRKLAYGKPVLIDLKTCTGLKKKPDVSWLLQLGAYYGLLLDNDISISGAIILQFSKKDKGMVPLEINITTLDVALEHFRIARQLFEFYRGI